MLSLLKDGGLYYFSDPVFTVFRIVLLGKRAIPIYIFSMDWN
jgi:hypothetical protein